MLKIDNISDDVVDHAIWGDGNDTKSESEESTDEDSALQAGRQDQ